MKTKHTPGPWNIRDDNETGNVSIVGGSHIILARVRTATVEPGDENARLIASAPELLEALQLCREHMCLHASNTGDGAFDKLCEAIAKATGE